MFGGKGLFGPQMKRKLSEIFAKRRVNIKVKFHFVPDMHIRLVSTNISSFYGQIIILCCLLLQVKQILVDFWIVSTAFGFHPLKTLNTLLEENEEITARYFLRDMVWYLLKEHAAQISKCSFKIKSQSKFILYRFLTKQN